MTAVRKEEGKEQPGEVSLLDRKRESRLLPFMMRSEVKGTPAALSSGLRVQGHSSLAPLSKKQPVQCS